MKKISALLLAGVLTISMSACAMLQPDEATSNMEHNEPNISSSIPTFPPAQKCIDLK